MQVFGGASKSLLNLQGGWNAISPPCFSTRRYHLSLRHSKTDSCICLGPQPPFVSLRKMPFLCIERRLFVILGYSWAGTVCNSGAPLTALAGMAEGWGQVSLSESTPIPDTAQVNLLRTFAVTARESRREGDTSAEGYLCSSCPFCPSWCFILTSAL